MVIHLAFLLMAAPITEVCVGETNQMLALPYAQFDQDPNGGWRVLEKQGCQLAAADLIRSYRHQNRQISFLEHSNLSWHEGQLRAIKGDYVRAIPLLLAGVPENDPIDFTDYALGTVAFLKRDKPALNSAIRRLSVTKWRLKAEDSGDRGNQSVRLAVKLNLAVLEGLNRCFNKSYKIAYNCR